MLVQDRPATVTLAEVRAEYLDMPGLKLTEQQAQRLFHLDCPACKAVLDTLVDVGFLRRTDDGMFVRFELASPLVSHVGQSLREQRRGLRAVG